MGKKIKHPKKKKFQKRRQKIGRERERSVRWRERRAHESEILQISRFWAAFLSKLTSLLFPQPP